ncbi:MAG: transposase, partial [Candidatus Marsarchaeota archaeon]|nr:transposase [Candidatus Marsarchaeota archaeon]
MANIEKNNKIKEKGKETRIRRRSQEARVFEIKFDANKISNQKLNNIRRVFLEGKWFTNYIIAKGITESIPYKDYNVKKVNIKVNDASEERELNIL